MTDCCGTPKEKPFGTWKCKELGCKDLEKDPEYPSSVMRCGITNSIPGNMGRCAREMDAEQFLRQYRGTILNGLHNFNAPSPGVRNCPTACPYKVEKGMKCGFTGEALKAWGTCPCNVLGNPEQEKQLEKLWQIISVRRERPFMYLIGGCQKDCPCPDGVQRCKEGDESCPVIRTPFTQLMECPLWRIPAKTLPAIADPVIPEKPDPEVSEKPESSQGKVTQKEKIPSRNSSPKEKTASSPKKPTKPVESVNPLRQFLNNHHLSIIEGVDVPIVPAVHELYDEINAPGTCKARLFIAAEEPKGRWNWFSLSPSGKIRRVKGPIGSHRQGSSYPDCKFRFEWHYDDKKNEE